MQNTLTNRENSPNKKNLYNALILSLLLHTLLFLLLYFLNLAKVENKELPLVKVSVNFNSNELGEQIKYKALKMPQKTNSNSMNENGTDKYSEAFEDKGTMDNQNSDSSLNNPSQNRQKSSEEKDFFAEYEKSELEKSQNIEKSFFTDSNNKNNNANNNDEGNELAFLEGNLKGNKDNNNVKNSSNKNKENQNGSLGNMEDGSINWEGGSKRKLVKTCNINVSEKFIKEGLKTSIKLKFYVLANGLINKVDIIMSTGFTELDLSISSQFKSCNKFEAVNGDFQSVGTVVISLKY